MKVNTPYRVVIGVEQGFGQRLEAFSPGEAVWVIDSPINTPVAQRLWRSRAGETHLTGITTFNGSSKSSPEDDFIANLDTVDLHHGEYSADPPYSILQVIGCEPSDRLREAVGEIGFEIVSTSSAGFVAVRRVAQ